MHTDTLELARQLIARPSLSPSDGGCQDLLVERLAAAGFEIERLLRVLWRLGPSTVRSVHEELSGLDRNLGYTTVLKFLQIMLDKGLVKREDSQRAHVYRPAISREQTQRQLTRQLIDGAFDGSRSQLVLQALSGADRVKPEELQEIRALLDRLDVQN